MISVCYTLSYYSPNYVRTRTLIKALREIDNIKLYQARNSSKGVLRYFQTLSKLIVIRVIHNPEFYILGFRGYELYWLVRLITMGRTLIFDHMMSPYDSLVNEHKMIAKGELVAKLACLYEKAILRSADVVLTDTDIHKEYFSKFFNVPSKKILAIPVGTDEELFHVIKPPRVSDENSPFEILFYGSFLPLHGVDVILKSALLLRDAPIHFTLIGGHRGNLSKFQQMVVQLGLDNVTHVNWVEFESLPRLIAQTGIGLGGPFGNTGQGHRVITGKTFQFLAMARPVIVGKIDDDCGFEDKVNCLVVPQGDEKALAEAIRWAFHHQTDLNQIGWQGYNLYQSRYSIKRISEKMRGSFSS